MAQVSAYVQSRRAVFVGLTARSPDVSDRNFDRVRRDGLILERSSKSPYVLDIYGYCGFGIITPFATSKDSLADVLCSFLSQFN